MEKQLRERVVFARQDVLNDPPFSRMNLISCRNLLIYLNASKQNQLIDTFRFALREDGYLLLGTSESVAARSREFKTFPARRISTSASRDPRQRPSPPGKSAQGASRTALGPGFLAVSVHPI